MTTAEPITVMLASRRRKSNPPVPATGEVVVLGLVVAPYLDHDDCLSADRFSLYHQPSGLGLPTLTNRCRIHIDQAIAVLREYNSEQAVDWDVDRDVLTSGDNRPRLLAALDAATAVVRRGCRKRRCGEDVPSYQARCKTCDWTSDEDEDDGPLDATEIAELARDHECEPRVEIRSPNADDDGWLPLDSFDEEGDSE